MRVDERLQRRAGRAHRPRHVERAAPRHRAELGIADMSEDAAVAVVDRPCAARVALRVERGRLAAQQGFELALQQRIDRRALLRSTRCGVAQCPRQMRRVKRQSQPARRDRLAARLGQHLRGDDALVGHSDQHPVASRARGVGVAIGTQPLRRARNGDQKRRLGRREPGRFLVRNRPGLRLAIPRDCRRTAPASYRSPGCRPWPGAARGPAPLRSRPVSRRAFADARSSSRTVCIVNVEAPETTRQMSRRAGRTARRIAAGSTPGWLSNRPSSAATSIRR